MIQMESRLTVETTLRPEQGEPGQSAEVEVAVKDSTGQPAEASMALTVFDRSLEQLGDPLPTAQDRIPDRISKRDYLRGIGWLSSSQD